MIIGPSKPETLAFLRALAKGINAKRGTINCAHCALRFDEHMAAGENLALGAVPKENANFDFYPFIKKGKITKTFTQDQRMLDRTTSRPKDYRIIIDIDNQSGETLEIDLTTGSQPQDRVYFFSASEENIIQALQALPRREKDGTAYGFITLTHHDKNNGHILNYFVDNDNQVYFIDAQHSTISRTLDLTGYLPEIFYRPSIPTDGIKLKKEANIIIKQEHDIPAANEVVKLENFICHAAYSNNQELTDSSIEKMIERGLSPNFNRIAAFAARGGHYGLAEYILNKIADDSKRDYNLVAAAAARNERQAAEYFLSKIADDSKRDYNLVATGAIRNGRQAAEYFLNKIADENKRDYKRVLYAAVEIGDEKLVEHFLSKTVDESKRDYNKVAALLAQWGHQTSAEYFLNKIVDGSKRNYTQVAAAAARGGHQTEAEYFLNKIADESKRDYKRMAAFAERGGHPLLATYFRKKDSARLIAPRNSEAEALLFRSPTVSKIPDVNDGSIEQELLILREKEELLKSELATKNQLIALQEKKLALQQREIDELRRQLHKQEPRKRTRAQSEKDEMTDENQINGTPKPPKRARMVF